MRRRFALALLPLLVGCTTDAVFPYPDLSGIVPIQLPDGGLQPPDGAPDLTMIDAAEGGAAMLAADPSMLSFGPVLDGTRSSNPSVTISNSGYRSLISSITVSGAGFVLAKESCLGQFLAGSSSCSASVRFEPLTAGDATGMLTVSGSSSGSVTVALSGQGVAPGAIAFMPNSVNLGSVPVGPTPVDARFGLANTGLIDTGPITLGLSGGGTNELLIIDNNCSAGLAPGASCSVTVSFQAKLTGATSATLTATDAQGGSATATLNATGS